MPWRSRRNLFHELALLSKYGVRTLLEADGAQDLERAPLVVEATGSDAGLELAMRLVSPRGKIVLKTTTASKTTIALAPLVINEVAVVGSRCGDLAVAVDWLARGAIDPTPLIAARYPLSQADEALQHAAMPAVLKVLVAGC